LARRLAHLPARPFAQPQPLHNSDDASNDCVNFRNVRQFLLHTARFDDSQAPTLLSHSMYTRRRRLAAAQLLTTLTAIARCRIQLPSYNARPWRHAACSGDPGEADSHGLCQDKQHPCTISLQFDAVCFCTPSKPRPVATHLHSPILNYVASRMEEVPMPLIEWPWRSLLLSFFV